MSSYHNVTGQKCVLTCGCGASGHVFPIRCGSWDCEVCSAINALHWAIKTREACNVLRAAGEDLYFALFTFDGTLSAKESFERLPAAWDKLRRKIQAHAKKQDTSFEYCAFAESQKRGHVHLHVITNVKATKTQAKAWAKESGFGMVADWQPVRTDGAVSWYISKYAAKTSQKQQMPKGFRRIRTSEGWPKITLEVEKTHGTAVIKERNESPLEFAFRVKTAFPHLDFDEVFEGAHNVLYQSQ